MTKSTYVIAGTVEGPKGPREVFWTTRRTWRPKHLAKVFTSYRSVHSAYWLTLTIHDRETIKATIVDLGQRASASTKPAFSRQSDRPSAST